jgi:hypothetical protein
MKMAGWKQYTGQKVKLTQISKHIVEGLGEELCNGLHEFFEHNTTDGRRTQIIKCALARIGDKLHYKVYANKLSGCPPPSDGGEWKSREWLYDLHWYTEVDDIKVKDLRKFIEMLRRADCTDKLSPYLWDEMLNAEQRKTLEHYRPSASSATDAHKIVDQLLKDIIKGPSIYKRSRFNGKSLKDISTEANTLLNKWTRKRKKRLKRKSRAVSCEKILKRHNRLLLQCAYPETVLSRNHEYVPTSLSLVAEFEWRPKREEDSIVPYSGFKFDFQKLLVANADLKLMVFRTKANDESFSELDDYFEKAISSYTNLKPGSRFLFIAVVKGEDGFFYDEKLVSRQ